MHSALDHGIGRFGVHDIQDRMNHLIAFDAESDAPRIVFVSYGAKTTIGGSPE